MDEQIIKALMRLDPLNDNHWTAQGLPPVSLVAEYSGLPDVKRADINAAAPNFSRDNPHLPPYVADGGNGNDEESLERKSDDDVDDDDAQAEVDEIQSGISRLEAERAEAQEALAETERHIALLEKKRKNLTEKADTLTAQIEHQMPQQSNQQAILDYIASNNREREKKALRRQGLIDAGVDSSELRSIKAPIDKSFERGRGRGQQRPKFPLNG